MNKQTTNEPQTNRQTNNPPQNKVPYLGWPAPKFSVLELTKDEERKKKQN